jgi:hypothetical protein
VVSLVDLPRPFNALKALDIDALAEQVLNHTNTKLNSKPKLRCSDLV